jgi:hypothetical protein
MEVEINVDLMMALNKVKLSASYGARGGTVVEALRYKPPGREIDSQWCQRNFSFT